MSDPNSQSDDAPVVENQADEISEKQLENVVGGAMPNPLNLWNTMGS